MKFLKKVVAAASVALMAAVPMSSHATLYMTIDDLSIAGVEVQLSDASVIEAYLRHDFSPANKVGTWTMGTTGTGNGWSSLFGIDLNSIAASSNGGGTIRITLTETNLTLGANGGPVTIDSFMSATTQGSMAFSSWLDDANRALDLTDPIAQGTMLFSGSSSEMAFRASGQGTTLASDPFAITLQVDITHTGRATSSFDFQASVPEPSSLALLSVALLGAGFAARRRKA